MKILQIIPADGWYAAWSGASGREDYQPLACWALIDGYGGAIGESIVGLVTEDGTKELVLADATNLSRYVHRDDLPLGM